MSLPEVLLWRELRQRPGGFKFRRQHPLGPYVADFLCVEARLIVEVDGESHSRADRPARDQRRDAAMRGQGLAVLRIAAADALGEMDATVRTIVGECLARGGPSTGFAGPPPPSGEE